MKYQLIAMVVVGVISVTGGAGAGEVVLAEESAHQSELGVRCSVSGTGDQSFIEDRHPSAEDVYRAHFWFNVSELVMANKSGHVIFEAVGPVPDGGGGDARAIDVQLLKNKKGKLKVKATAYHEPGVTQKKIKTKAVLINGTRWNHLTLEWRASSSNQAPDGLLRLTVEQEAGGTSVSEVNGRTQNERLVIEKARVGAVRGVDAGTSGAFSIDTFESYRELNGE